MSHRVLFLTLLAFASNAAVHQIVVRERADVAGGKSFGAAGAYESITATAHFRINPRLPQNRSIVDIDLAPVNADGMVEFTADVLLMRPRDAAKANGTALIDIPNRGRMLVLTMFNRTSLGDDANIATTLGDGFLFERGFTIVSIGWQWDVPDAPGRIGLDAPKLRGDVRGLVRSEFVPSERVRRFSLGDRDHRVYPVADETAASNRLYVRDGPGQPRREIARSNWRFVDKTNVEVGAGCEPGKIYEVVYTATGAVPVGLGFAAVRDISAFFKHGDAKLPGGSSASRTIAFGVSQTGRFLRHMMYEGFNQDESGKRALDGVWAHVAGAGRGGFNHRFAQPSRDGQSLLHLSWPVDLFPFRDDGLLKRVTALGVVPKIFYTNNSYEYWGRSASLIHTSDDNRTDAEPGNLTRIYFFTGGQHGAGSLPLSRTGSQNLHNPIDFRWGMRALLLAFHEWLKEDTAPPQSVYPRIAKGELVPPASVKYPPTLQAPRYPRIPTALDFGPDFLTKGIVSIEPPKEGKAVPILVPQVDGDGNEISGIKMPEVAVPLGTFTGWNLRAAATGAPEHLYAFVGSFLPFQSATIQQRYGDRSAYLERVRKACEDLAARRFALASDIDSMVARSGQLWDAVEQAR